jgi:hypothetical protein
VRFTLTYDGPLKPSGTAADKMVIREQLHPQLIELWRHEPLLGSRNLVEPGGMHLGDVRGFSFAAVVHDHFRLRAELDVLMLHAGPPGRILVHADIDNRLKTLFDSLSWPQQTQQIPTGWAPASDQQDDRHITRIGIETERWFAAPDPLHVRLFVRVKVWSPTPTYGGQALGV